MFGLEVYLIGFILIGIARMVSRFKGRREVDRNLDDWAEALGLVRVGEELVGQIDGVPVGARFGLRSSRRVRRHLDALRAAAATARSGASRSLSPDGRGGAVRRQVRHAHRQSAVRRTLQVQGGRAVARRGAAWSRGDEHRPVGSPSRGAAAHQRRRRGRSGTAAARTEAWLRQGLQAVVTIAKALNDARDHVSVAYPLTAHRQHWARFASHNGLHGISAPLCMWGTLQGSTIYATPTGWRRRATASRSSSGSSIRSVWDCCCSRCDRGPAQGLLRRPGPPPRRRRVRRRLPAARLDARGVEELLDAPLRQRILALHGRWAPSPSPTTAARFGYRRCPRTRRW